MSLLRHIILEYYCILLHIITYSHNHIIAHYCSLLHIITKLQIIITYYYVIITYYYVFETEQLADDLCSSACLYKPTIHTPCLPASRPQASRDSRPPGQTRCPSPTRPCPTRPAQLHLILPDPACPPTPPDLVRVRPPPTTSRAELWLLACAPSCTR